MDMSMNQEEYKKIFLRMCYELAVKIEKHFIPRREPDKFRKKMRDDSVELLEHNLRMSCVGESGANLTILLIIVGIVFGIILAIVLAGMIYAAIL